MAHLLVVDDEPRILSFVSRALVARGYAVDGAVDGAQALHLSGQRSYDLVVLDLRMPGLDGAAVLRALTAIEPTPRVIFLSAVADVRTKVELLEMGASDYLSKPFAIAELIARVRANLRQPDPPPDNKVVPGVPGLTLDVERRAVHTERGVIPLPGREFLLLQCLIRAGSGVCTRQELLSEVWGYAHDPGSNVVEVYVGRLRAKLGSEMIRTVRNVGYSVAS
jgi:two-component system, OmpR family, response regulator